MQKNSRGHGGKEALRLRSNEVDIEVCQSGGFYANNGGYVILKENWGGLIELRLD